MRHRERSEAIFLPRKIATLQRASH